MTGLPLTLAGEGRVGKGLGRGKKDGRGMKVVLAQNGSKGQVHCAKIPQRHGNDPSVSLFIPNQNFSQEHFTQIFLLSFSQAGVGWGVPERGY